MKFNKQTNLQDLTHLEAQDWEESDPDAFAEAVKRLDNRIGATYERHAGKHPTFDKMWKSGELQKFMAENPGHNILSAHMTLMKKVLPADQDPNLQNTGERGILNIVAGRLARSRQGTSQVGGFGEVFPGDPPPGSSPDETPTVDDYVPDPDQDEPIPEPQDINTLTDDGYPVPEE